MPVEDLPQPVSRRKAMPSALALFLTSERGFLSRISSRIGSESSRISAMAVRPL